MPRFLNTWTGEFEWHPDPKTVTYAVLSHVWRDSRRGGEQSYDDVRRLQVAVKERRNSQGPLSLKRGPSTSVHMLACDIFNLTKYHEEDTIFSHPKLSDKIKGFCKVARKAGFRLVWSDACCIDKTSSAELSEAINSMYEWYRLSDMCYVYMVDVPDGDRPQDSGSEFWKSRWHTRGWTLQELIAPERVVFLTSTWNFLGTKLGLARTLEECTGVDFAILTGRATLSSVSVARRMSWASGRVTTRVEDRAYSLLGIFGVHMSPIYGEGDNAFLRLQEEIIRTIPDQSIFAWGDGRTVRSLSLDNEHDRRNADLGNPGLLASSPTSFTHSRGVTLITCAHFARIVGLRESEAVPTMHCIFTPQGARMRLLCLPLSGVPHILEAFRRLWIGHTCAECSRLGEVDTLALLQCRDAEGHLIALPLCRACETGGTTRGFFIGTHAQCSDEYHRPFRTVRISKAALTELLENVRPVVAEVSLLRRHSHPPIPKSLEPHDSIRYPSFWFDNRPDQVVFDIAPHSIDALAVQGLVPLPLQVAHSEREISMKTTLALSGGDSIRPENTWIEVCLSLTKQETPRGGGYIDEALLPERLKFQDPVQACFSVKGVDFVVLNSGTSPFTNTSHHVSIHTPRISKATGSSTGDHCGRLTSTLAPYELPRRTIAHAEYTVYVESDQKHHWSGDTATCMVRLLRVALELPFARPHGLYTTNLWLSIAISEEYMNTRLIDNSPDILLEPTGGTLYSDVDFCPLSLRQDSSLRNPFAHGDEILPSSFHVSSPGMCPQLNPGHAAMSSMPPSACQSDSSSSASSLDTPYFAQATASLISGPQDPLFDHSMTCFSQPRTECNSTLFWEKSPFTWPWLSDPSTLVSNPVDLGYSIGHGVYSDYQSIGAAWADKSTAKEPEGTTFIVSQPEVQHVPPFWQYEGASNGNSVSGDADITVVLPQSLYDVEMTCGAPENVEIRRPPAGYHLSASTAYFEGYDTLDLTENTYTPYAKWDMTEHLPDWSSIHFERSCEPLGEADAPNTTKDCNYLSSQREIATLRAQVEHLMKRNEALSLQNAALASRMDAVFARLDALSVSAAVNAI